MVIVALMYTVEEGEIGSSMLIVCAMTSFEVGFACCDERILMVHMPRNPYLASLALSKIWFARIRENASHRVGRQMRMSYDMTRRVAASGAHIRRWLVQDTRDAR